MLGSSANYAERYDWGMIDLTALDKARAALLAYAGQFAGKDLRTMAVAFKPGLSCN